MEKKQSKINHCAISLVEFKSQNISIDDSFFHDEKSKGLVTVSVNLNNAFEYDVISKDQFIYAIYIKLSILDDKGVMFFEDYANFGFKFLFNAKGFKSKPALEKALIVEDTKDRIHCAITPLAFSEVRKYLHKVGFPLMPVPMLTINI